MSTSTSENVILRCVRRIASNWTAALSAQRRRLAGRKQHWPYGLSGRRHGSLVPTWYDRPSLETTPGVRGSRMALTTRARPRHQLGPATPAAAATAAATATVAGCRDSPSGPRTANIFHCRSSPITDSSPLKIKHFARQKY